MNTNLQLKIDKYVARPIALVLNVFVKILGKILRINHDLNEDFRTIAICKFKGMGSIIQVQPLILSLKDKFPSSQITFISTISNASILNRIEGIDKTIFIDDSNFLKLIISLCKSLVLLIRTRNDVYLDLEIYSDFSSIYTTFSLSKNRIGYYLRSSSYKMGMYTHMMFYNTEAPISQTYLQLAGMLGGDTSNSALKLSLPDAEQLALAENKEYIVINVNASDLRIERRWPAEYFIKLLQDLTSKDSSILIFLIGSKDEIAYTDGICSLISHQNVISLAGKTTIDQLILLISKAKIMVTNDTGPMHIAFALNTKTISLFGPCSPDQYGKGENTLVMYKKMYCSPCVHSFMQPPCKGNNQCMKQISVDEVIESIENFDRKILNTVSNTSQAMIYTIQDEHIGLVKR
jgi:ADP-heptose:LPS heptosyltransferase